MKRRCLGENALSLEHLFWIIDFETRLRILTSSNIMLDSGLQLQLCLKGAGAPEQVSFLTTDRQTENISFKICKRIEL